MVDLLILEKLYRELHRRQWLNASSLKLPKAQYGLALLHYKDASKP